MSIQRPTSSSPIVPTQGEISSGTLSGTKNSYAFGPCGRIAPLITGLLSRLSLGFEIDIRAVVVLLSGVAAKFTMFPDILRAGRTPFPLQEILNVLQKKNYIYIREVFSFQRGLQWSWDLKMCPY